MLVLLPVIRWQAHNSLACYEEAQWVHRKFTAAELRLREKMIEQHGRNYESGARQRAIWLTACRPGAYILCRHNSKGCPHTPAALKDASGRYLGGVYALGRVEHFPAPQSEADRQLTDFASDERLEGLGMSRYYLHAVAKVKFFALGYLDDLKPGYGGYKLPHDKLQPGHWHEARVPTIATSVPRGRPLGRRQRVSLADPCRAGNDARSADVPSLPTLRQGRGSVYGLLRQQCHAHGRSGRPLRRNGVGGGVSGRRWRVACAPLHVRANCHAVLQLA